MAASILRLTSAEKMPQAVAADSSVVQLSNVAGSALGGFRTLLGVPLMFFARGRRQSV